jgi:hypothetical protein
MANWHALTGTLDGNTFRIAYHVPIPSAVNEAGINYRDALKNSGLGAKTVLADGNGQEGTISVAEKNDILNGVVFEVVENIDTNPGESAAALIAKVNARHAALVTQHQAELAAKLKYYGYVPA